MNNKQFGVLAFAVGFGVISFICAVVFMAMAKNLKNQVINYKESGCVINEQR